MKTTPSMAALTAALLTLSSLGFAKDDDDGRRRNDRERSDHDRGQQRGGPSARRGNQRGYERGPQYGSPPRGYHWVQTGADYVLVAIATGIILQIILAQLR